MVSRALHFSVPPEAKHLLTLYSLHFLSLPQCTVFCCSASQVGESGQELPTTWRLWDFKQASGALRNSPPSLCPSLCRASESPGLRADRKRCSLLVSITLSHLSPGTVILSAEVLALRRARQVQRRAQQASLQLSKEQKALVQILLGAHTRHMGTMFDQFVQFRVSTYRIPAGL